MDVVLWVGASGMSICMCVYTRTYVRTYIHTFRVCSRPVSLGCALSRSLSICVLWFGFVCFLPVPLFLCLSLRLSCDVILTSWASENRRGIRSRAPGPSPIPVTLGVLYVSVAGLRLCSVLGYPIASQNARLQPKAYPPKALQPKPCMFHSMLPILEA